MPTQATVSIIVDAPPAVVWPFVADITRHPEWSPKDYQVDLVSGEPNSVGSRYRSLGWVPPNDSNHSNDVEITEVVPVSRFGLKATDGGGTFVNTFDLRPLDAGTEVSFHIEFPAMKGLNAVLVPLLFPIVAKPDFRKRLSLLKKLVESSARPD